MTDDEILDEMLERSRDWSAWLNEFVADPESETWAHPCPRCGVHVTDPIAHLRRAHGNSFEVTP